MSLDMMAAIFVYLAFLSFAAKRTLTYMHVFQQEEYDNYRTFIWILRHKVFDKKLSILIAGVGLFEIVNMGYGIPSFVTTFMAFILFSVFALTEKDPRKSSKKKLAMTTRVKRILLTSMAFLAALALPAVYFDSPWIWIICIHLIVVSLLLANFVLQPLERAIQKQYWDDAKAHLSELDPTIIAITGSYGKTSVKHILGHILSVHAPTLITPGSVNTPMGITRIIREQLNESHKYFIVEMGAYGPGSIKRLCDLTPPDMGIITAIGHAHYERFKTLDTVAKAKFELAEAVINRGGKTVIHERTIRFVPSRALKNKHPENFIVVGDAPLKKSEQKDECHLTVDDIQITKVYQTIKGVHVSLQWRDKLYDIKAPIFGVHHGHNLALAFVMALELGMEFKAITAALKSLPQIRHRLDVKRQPDGTILIDDAFNSNPVGFRSALELMPLFEAQKYGARNILITPGIVELGAAHDDVHFTLGKVAAEIVDIAIIVVPERMQAFIDGYHHENKKKPLIRASTFDEAFKWVEANKMKNDVILMENDLPDIYERIPSL